MPGSARATGSVLKTRAWNLARHATPSQSPGTPLRTYALISEIIQRFQNIARSQWVGHTKRPKHRDLGGDSTVRLDYRSHELQNEARNMNIVKRLQNAIYLRVTPAIVEFQSQRQRFRTLRQQPVVHHEKPYNGERVLLLALYQKGYLRPDLVRLLEEAKAQGLYVLAINTLKLKQPSEIADLVDCYIEKANFGRDFGSYKTGFLHLYARGWAESCPRLLMLNDSIYYSTRGLEKFIRDLMQDGVEVLGATENYDIEHHLGSFCISMSSDVLNSKKMKEYWRDYQLSDVRPKVIKRGEMELSKTLKSCVTRPSQFAALYSSDHFLNAVKNDPDLQNLVITDSRTCSEIIWPRFDVEKVTRLLSGRTIARQYPPDKKVDVNIVAPIKELNEEVLITNREDLLRYLLRNVSQPVDNFEEVFGETISAVASEVFMSGSQIHQNPAILLALGLPIIKLDGLYRGAFNVYDILRIQKKLKQSEASEVSRLLMDRPFGGKTLLGWKRAAFLRGML